LQRKLPIAILQVHFLKLDTGSLGKIWI